MDLPEIEELVINLKSEGKKLIGIFPHQFIPLELIHACKAHPLVLSLAASDEICSLGTEYLTPATCPFARSCVGHFDSGNKIYSSLDGLIGLNYCNGELCAVDYIDRYFKVPQIQFAFPTIISDSSRIFFSHQVFNLKKNLEKILNIQISDEDLIESIDLYNKLRLKLQSLQKEIGMGSNFQKVLHDFYLSGPEFILNENKNIESNDTKNGKKALFLGSFVGKGDKILEIIEECDINIIKNQSESIFYFNKEINKEDPLNSIANFYFDNNYSFRMINDGQKIDQIIKEFEKGAFEAVIFHVLKFCDLYVAGLSKFKNIMAENDIPTLILERDYAESLGQLSTRIEAFREILS